MSSICTFRKKHLRVTAGILLILGTGCGLKSNNSAAGWQFSADATGNAHLGQVIHGKNKDSIEQYATMDFDKQQYNVFWAATPADGLFNHYVTAYAKKKYHITLISCECRSAPGAFYYNDKMTALINERTKKTLPAIYAEAKEQYEKWLWDSVTNKTADTSM